MIEFKASELSEGDEFTVNDGETWYRVEIVTKLPAVAKPPTVIVTANVVDMNGNPGPSTTLTYAGNVPVIVR